MKKTVLFIIALLVGFLYVSAQSDIYPKLPTIKKTESVQDRWLPDSVYLHWWQSSESSWTIGELYTYTYDLNNNLLTRLMQGRNYNSWINGWLRTYTYDSNNNILSEMIQKWENNLWKDYWYIQFSYTYDSNNNILTKMQLNTYLYTYTYDSNNNILTEIRQGWENNSWKNSESYTYTYDSNNTQTVLWQKWENNSWENYRLATYTYDSNNNKQTELWQNWNNNSWVNLGVYTYTYDSSNNLLTELWQGWGNNSFVNGGEYRRIYDENGNGISAEHWEWVNGSWRPTNHQSATVIQRLYYNNMQSVVEEVTGDKITASYKKTTDTGKEKVKTDLPVEIYSSGKIIHINNLTGKNAVVSVYRVDGVKVAERTMTSQTTAIEIPVSGFYFVSVKTGNEEPVTAKLIVR